MGGLRHIRSRRLLLVAATALTVLAVPAVSGAGSSQSEASLHAQDAALAAKSRSAVLGLYSLDQQVVAAKTHLASLRGQLAELRQEQAAVRTGLSIARHDTHRAQSNLARRLRLLYAQGNVEPLEILFGARSLDDALTSLDSLKGIANQDSAIVGEVTGARARYETLSGQLASRTQALVDATNAAAATAGRLQLMRDQRSGYIDSLAAQRRLTDGQITQLIDEASAAQLRSTQLTQGQPAPVGFGAPSSPFPTPAGPLGGGETLTVVATGYALPGTTATGLPVGWGIAAVDPRVIPLGSHLTVPGYGEAVAADTGGAIIGDAIDLWFPSVALADDWGRRVITITVQ